MGFCVLVVFVSLFFRDYFDQKNSVLGVRVARSADQSTDRLFRVEEIWKRRRGQRKDEHAFFLQSVSSLVAC